jgi:hypothetical protein
MTTNYHTPITTGAAANAQTFNDPMAEFDQALTDALLTEKDGHIIQDEGVDLPQQARLDFQGDGVSAANGSGKTVITIPGGIGQSAADARYPRKWTGKTTAPTVNDDSGDGYAVGDRWLDETNDKEYACLDATVGAAVWIETTATGGGGGGDFGDLAQNLTIVVSRTGNAETIAIKNKAGNDPSAGDPVKISFRDVAAGTGGYTVLELTAAESITIPSTATMGMSNGVAARLWLLGINDGGTFRLAVVNAPGKLDESGLISATAIDTAADVAGTVYGSAAVTSKAFRILGYLEYTLAAAGTWGTAPSKIQIFGAGINLPGSTVQVVRYPTGEVQSAASVIPLDDSIPQSGEGTEIFSKAISPSSAINKLLIQVLAHVALSESNYLMIALFQDATANALATAEYVTFGSNGSAPLVISHYMTAGTISATTFKVRCGTNGGGTWTLNGTSGARKFGGTFISSITIMEIME